MDNDQVKAILEAVTAALRSFPVDDDDDDEDEVMAAPEVAYGYDGRKKKLPKAKCEVPRIALFIIFTKCLTINNGACPEWDFCNDKKRKVVKNT